LEVIVTLDIGPRIMHFSLPGRGNILEDETNLSEMLPGGSMWRIYGDHRAWHSPEPLPRSNISDSFPLDKFELQDDRIIMYQKEESWTKIVKSIVIHIGEDSVRVTNNLTNNVAYPL
jgi:hypothetical protein